MSDLACAEKAFSEWSYDVDAHFAGQYLLGAEHGWHAALQWAWATKQPQVASSIPEPPSVDLSQEEPPDPHALVFSYEEMLAAWVAGRHNFRLYGDTGYDAPDFATWLKERNNPR